MRTSRIAVGAMPLLALLLAATSWIAAQNTTQPHQDAKLATPPAALLDVGAPAPPVRATTWLNGRPVDVQRRGKPAVLVLTFWASWSGPSRAALAELVKLHEKYHQRGVVFVGVTDESVEDIRTFLRQSKPPLPFPVAIDDQAATTRAYCRASGVGFVPYAFVLGPERTIAWHGHPQQAELLTIVEQLLAGRYDRAQARQLVRQSRSVDQLEALFREACANEAWHTALLALDGLLDADVPKARLLRYKLSILLGELDEGEQARALAEELTQRYAEDARFLNGLAWDVVSQPRLYLRAPEVGLMLARAAYRASRGQDAAVADTYARALHTIGRVDLAIQVQSRAVQLCDPQQRPGHQRTLAAYKRCQALQAEATADPT